MNKLKPAHHQHCIACGDPQLNTYSMGLTFSLNQLKEAWATVKLGDRYQGYSGVLHGGVISTLLDDAMVNRLFFEGVEAMTAELKVRFVRPIPVSQTLRLSAQLVGERRGIYSLTASLCVDQLIYAKAQAKFIAAGPR
ncbi:PaaI family thioesterase [Agarivorans sp. DSG3-1]|uniref:PaaI family thioesterase n=1 Tax=Agarivorans sp. DSG3-1 TaxID=3342249 RepID=UPI00398E63EC